MCIKRITAVSVVVVSAAVFISCGGSKSASYGGSSSGSPSSGGGSSGTSSPNYNATTEVKKGEPLKQTGQGVEIENTPCEDSAMAINGSIRALGIGISKNQPQAMDKATTQAEANLVRQLEATIDGAMSIFTDEAGEDNDLVYGEITQGEKTTLWKQTVQGAVTICSKAYREKGDNYKYLVTKEIAPDRLNALYDNILQNKKRDAARETLEARREKFREHVQKMREKQTNESGD